MVAAALSLPVSAPVSARLTGASVGLLLDIEGLPAPHAAWSMRRLRALYQGSSINVRESGADDDADVGFYGAGLDEAALIAHVGANDGYLNTGYDQGPNGNDFTQGTDSLQWQIAASGAVNKIGARPCARNTVANNAATLTLAKPASDTDCSVLIVMRNDTDQCTTMAASTPASRYLRYYFNGSGAGVDLNVGTPTVFANNVLATETTANQWHDNRLNEHLVLFAYGLDLSDWADIQFDSPGGTGGGERYQEIIVWDSDVSAYRDRISRNAMAFYGIS